MEIDNILTSTRRRLQSKEITFQEAGRSLYLAGWFNFVPDENMVKALLGM